VRRDAGGIARGGAAAPGADARAIPAAVLRARHAPLEPWRAPGVSLNFPFRPRAETTLRAMLASGCGHEGI
jgi:hypothetical protein